jgi:hypothetical protein
MLHTESAGRTWLALQVILLCHALACAQSPPRLPCGREGVPLYPDVSNPPIVTFWSQSSLGLDWKPPACTGWTTDGFSTLVTIAARFRTPAGSEGLLRRIGAISQFAGMRYWSTTHQQWQTLVVEAHALTGPQGDHRRNDFSPQELKAGAVFYFEQLDNLSGNAVYRMHIAGASASRIVFDVENVSTMRYLMLTLFRPAELQSIYFLDRDTQDVWRYYGVARSGKNASSLTTGKQASSINRAVAFFRHLAGIPGDLEPPAAR